MEEKMNNKVETLFKEWLPWRRICLLRSQPLPQKLRRRTFYSMAVSCTVHYWWLSTMPSSEGSNRGCDATDQRSQLNSHHFVNHHPTTLLGKWNCSPILRSHPNKCLVKSSTDSAEAPTKQAFDSTRYSSLGIAQQLFVCTIVPHISPHRWPDNYIKIQAIPTLSLILV